MAIKYVYILTSILAVFGISVSSGPKAIAGEPDISTTSICSLVDTVIDFRLAQEEAADICGIDEVSGDKFCL
ncbi:MAG: hypothetical protein COA91_03995 [Robiginitomaculum sp.]|nr:MAG: hypothetical protein COA91_03995 [Robiginitomaculum sp.]